MGHLRRALGSIGPRRSSETAAILEDRKYGEELLADAKQRGVTTWKSAVSRIAGTYQRLYHLFLDARSAVPGNRL